MKELLYLCMKLALFFFNNDIYIYVYIYRERENDEKRERMRERMALYWDRFWQIFLWLS